MMSIVALTSIIFITILEWLKKSEIKTSTIYWDSPSEALPILIYEKIDDDLLKKQLSKSHPGHQVKKVGIFK